MPRPMVFVSAASEDYKELRHRLAKRLRREGIDVPCQGALWQKNGLPTLSMIEDNLRESWAVIHLVGPSFGHKPRETIVDELLNQLPPRNDPMWQAVCDTACKYTHSYTHWEAFLARYHRIPLHVYKPANATVFDDRQRDHLERLHDYYPTPFNNEASLLELVVAKLMGIRPPEPPPSHWEEIYLQNLIDKCDKLDLDLIARPNQNRPQNKVSTSAVYTRLYLGFDDQSVRQKVAQALNREHDIEPVEAAAILPRLVILGQPGGGKSTVVNYLVAQLARRWLTGAFDEGALPGWDSKRRCLPVRVILRDFAAWLPKSVTAPLSALVWAFFWRQLEGMICEQDFRSLKEEIIHGDAIILFDGLDEVSAADTNKCATIVAVINAFAAELRRCSIIVTCREFAFRSAREKDNWHLDQFPVATLAAFDMRLIHSFIGTWYKLFKPQDATEEAIQQEPKELFETIERWEHLQELARQPLLLTLLMIVHLRLGRLPENRAKLYNCAVHLLLEDWDNRVFNANHQRTVKRGRVARLNIRTRIPRNALADVAIWLHDKRVDGISEENLCRIIEHHLPRPRQLARGKRQPGAVTTSSIIGYFQERAGLLQAPANNLYTFPHRTFREYLAAVHLFRRKDFIDELCRRVFDDLTWWREVFLLAAGVAGGDTPQNIVSLVYSVLPKFAEQHVNAENHERALLLSQALWENPFPQAAQHEERPNPYGRTLETVQEWLLSSMGAETKLNAAQRVAAGVALARLGDTRKEVMSLDYMQFCYVPAGECYTSDNTMPVHVGPYWISRYPITQAQFNEFVRDDGYAKSEYWQIPDWDEKTRRCHLREPPAWNNGRYDRRTRPVDYPPPFGYPNHPVVGVTWFEALAFTRWLTERWQKLLSKDQEVRLPAEAEWVKAARGGLEIPKEPRLWVPKQDGAIEISPSCPLVENPLQKRLYPWGGSAVEPNRMNCKESGLVPSPATSAVGCFPGGASPYGCQDMGGNVAEWCFDRWKGGFDASPSFDYRVIRGGSHTSRGELCQLTQRAEQKSNGSKQEFGFRVVVSATSRPDLITEQPELSLEEAENPNLDLELLLQLIRMGVPIRIVRR